MAAATARIQPPPPPKLNDGTMTDKISKADAKTHDSFTSTKSSPSSSSVPVPAVILSNRYRPFTPLPPSTGPLDVNGKPDFSTWDGIHMLNEKDKLSHLGILPTKQLSTRNSVPTDYNNTGTDGTSCAKAVPAKEHILDYVYDWTAWAVEIPDPKRRNELLTHLMGALERVLKEGMERTGMTLGAQDVVGSKEGIKRTVQAEVNIHVTITSAIKMANPAVVEQDTTKNTTVATFSDSTSRQPVTTNSIQQEKPSNKRVAGETDHSDNMQDGKRQKLENGKGKAGTPDSVGNDSAEDEKRTRYLQQVFQPRLNVILKKAGKVMTRGRCTNWETMVARLRNAGVDVKHRNMMLQDFLHGYKNWNDDPRVDPNVAAAVYAHSEFKGVGERKPAAATSNKQAQEVTTLARKSDKAAVEGDAFQIKEIQPSRRIMVSKVGRYTTTSGPSLTVTIRTLPLFDPANVSSAPERYQYKSFEFSYNPKSTIKQRIAIQDVLEKQVDETLSGGVAEVGVQVDVKDNSGFVVVGGSFLNTAAAEELLGAVAL